MRLLTNPSPPCQHKNTYKGCEQEVWEQKKKKRGLGTRKDRVPGSGDESRSNGNAAWCRCVDKGCLGHWQLESFPEKVIIESGCKNCKDPAVRSGKGSGSRTSTGAGGVEEA